MPVDDSATASAIRRCEERLARDPTSLAFAPLADLYRKAGRTADAVALCRAGLARYPHYTSGRMVLAKALAADNQLAGALAELRAMLELNPNEADTHRLIAEILRRQGDVDGAVSHLTTAVALDPDDRESRTVLGLLRGDPGVGQTAGMARLLSDDTFVTVPFGALCLSQGLVEEAAQVFTRLLRKDPTNAEARDRLEEVLRARARRKG
jgi:Flp pilus assembly protein TadD